ncbi:hypothetical protein [Aquisphaera insulae]|uniref:hypothetical protein n=1 Tax=Aquisphaera insulae TaxID=2712864 RepID=UPI0013EC094D|nr:hypothetical protein [Aquisphaera insulae]
MADRVDAELWFARHLAVLEASYTVKHQTKPHEQARSHYSGFLLQVNLPGTARQATMWITAGHCMQEIEEQLLGRLECFDDVRFRFLDMLHANAVSELPMPFDYLGGHPKAWLYHTDDRGTALGMDFGVIFLRAHDADLMLGNRLEPVGPPNWVKVPETFDHYYMLGLPGELVRPQGQGIWSAQPILIPVERLHARPACYQEQSDPMFYGVVDTQERVKSIKGMSGGPILGLKLDENGIGRYWFIGVQSGWYPPERIVCATPLADVRDILITGMQRMLEQDAEKEEMAD